MLARLIGHYFLLTVLSTSLSLYANEVAPVEPVRQTWVRESHTTASFQDVEDRVAQLAKKHTADQVLFVVDIDNTLLAMNQDLGSDQWFGWQVRLLAEDRDSSDLVARDFDGLLKVQSQLFDLSQMHPPEPKLPMIIHRIQHQGVATAVLTSRSPGFRNATEREMKRNGYEFTSTSLAIDEHRGEFFPFNAQTPDAHGLSAQIIQQLESRLQPVSYASGIYMTAGQHKGYMLRTLLSRAVPSFAERHQARMFRAVVFVDDHEKHTKRMHQAFAGEKLDLVTYRYSREDGNVAAFNQSNKQHVVRGWKQLEKAMNLVLVK